MQTKIKKEKRLLNEIVVIDTDEAILKQIVQLKLVSPIARRVAFTANTNEVRKAPEYPTLMKSRVCLSSCQ